MDHQQPAQGFAHLSEAAIAEITIGAVIFIFLLFISALFYCLRAKGCWGAIPGFGGNSRRDSYVFSTEETSADVLRRGLDASAIKALSSLVYRPEDFKEGLECSVCLSELFAGDEARLLPLCNHVFHVECIDIWFQSHSTCPLCRSPVLASDKLENGIGCRAEVTEVHHETIDVNSMVSVTVSNAETGCSALDEGSSSSSNNSSGMLVVKMPRRVLDELPISSNASPLPLSDNSVEEIRSSSTTRLHSLRRFLRGVASPCSPGLPSGFDVEQGVGSVPKIPACF